MRMIRMLPGVLGPSSCWLAMTIACATAGDVASNVTGVNVTGGFGGVAEASTAAPCDAATLRWGASAWLWAAGGVSTLACVLALFGDASHACRRKHSVN